MSKELRYTGKVLTDPPYIPNKQLVDAVNLAILLQRPLLLKGEPGCGKTTLAKAVADELGLEFIPWPIKSTSRARDGLYMYDALRHLRESNQGGDAGIMEYIDPGPLGRAFAKDKPSVVLIDEIDKADIDFPNDLLQELEDRRYYIPEAQAWRPGKDKKGTAPLVFITSNDEKELSDAFLRRCLFCYIKFPNPQRLATIVEAHFEQAPQELVETAVTRFWNFREKMEQGRAAKKVSTSELLDWFAAVRHDYPDKKAAMEKMQEEPLPYAGALVKSWADHLQYIGDYAEEEVSPGDDTVVPPAADVEI